MSSDDQKKQAAIEAAKYVEDGMLIGLGTGSTAAHLVQTLGEKVRAGLAIKAIPTSEETRTLAISAGIEIIEPDETTQIDLVIDGADEVDPYKNLIKGGGGALLREKIVADSGGKMIVIADESKRVAQLGAFPLPIEIERFSWPLTIQKVRAVLNESGLPDISMQLRAGPKAAGGGVFRTDGGNYILDVNCVRIPDAPQLDMALRAIPGVIETGFFIALADKVIFGTDNGVEYL